MDKPSVFWVAAGTCPQEGCDGWDISDAHGDAIGWAVGPQCDKTRQANARLIASAPELLAACQSGDSLSNPGPDLLLYAADLVKNFAPVTASELRRKASLECAALAKAHGEVTK